VPRKRFYIHLKAQESYERILSESRSGANLTEGERLTFDALLYALTGKGQSFYAAMTNNPDSFSISLKTCYRYITSDLLFTKRHDLPRACSMKPRSSKRVEHKVDKQCRIGRTREDYLKFIEMNPGLRVVQMDTVEGIKGGKALLTLMFNPFGFMLAFLLESKTSECVIGVFQDIRDRLKSRYGQDAGREIFARLFPVILTDNDTEFSNPAKIEFDDDGSRLSFLFYCNPRASYEKAQCERNHVEVRRVLPKGTRYHETTSFDGLSQNDISLMMSHINSYVRKEIKGIPYDLFTKEYGEDITSLFNISRIKANDVRSK
jgi:IS30 family transposase